MSQIYLGFGGVILGDQRGNYSAYLADDKRLDQTRFVDINSGSLVKLRVELRNLKPKLGHLTISFGNTQVQGSWAYDGKEFVFIGQPFSFDVSVPQSQNVLAEESAEDRRARQSRQISEAKAYTAVVKELIAAVFKETFGNGVEIHYWGETHTPSS